MKGTWQARSLSAGQWVNGNTPDFRLTGRQIDSWPARSLSCFYSNCGTNFWQQCLSKLDFETNLLQICSNITLPIWELDFETFLPKFITLQLRELHFEKILPQICSNITLQLWELDFETILPQICSKITLQMWELDFETLLPQFCSNITLQLWELHFETILHQICSNITL